MIPKTTVHRHAPTLLLSALLTASASAQDFPWVMAAFGESIADAGDLTGRSLATLHDVNGDGADEIVIGAPDDEDGGVGSGTVYVYSPVSNQILYEIHGAPGDNCGAAVANAGDPDRDFYDDFIVGFPGYDLPVLPPFVYVQDIGKAVIYSGKTGQVIFTITGPGEGARAGEAVAGAGNTDGDGYDDLLVGAPSYDVTPSISTTSNEGWAVLVSGHSGVFIAEYKGAPGDMLGASVAGVGDVSGDLFRDYAIGSPGDDYLSGGPFPIKVIDAGRLDVYAGKTQALLYSKSGGSGDELGTAVCAAGDSDADGVKEVLAGAPGDAGDEGSAYLYEGPTGTLLRTFASGGVTAADRFGSSVALLGDVDKDGHSDVAIGAPMDPGSIYGGYVRDYSGATGLPYGLQTSGSFAGDLLGSAIGQGPADVNADGWDDLVLSLPYSNLEGADSGYVWGLTFAHMQPNLGFQGPGTPWFSMYGTYLYTGGQADIRLDGNVAGAPCWLMASAFQALVPFKGGILVPDAAASLLVPFVADASGDVLLPGVPGGGGFVIVYAQWIIKTPGFAQGWQLSNALALEFLP